VYGTIDGRAFGTSTYNPRGGAQAPALRGSA